MSVIDRARVGDRDAFAELVTPLLGVTRRRLARTVGDADADDVVQATVLRSLRHIGGFRAECDFALWFWGNSRTELAERRRRGSAAKRSAALVPLDAAVGLAAPPRVDGACLWHDIQLAASHLPEGQRDVVEQVFMGRSLSEAAAQLDISPAAAKSRWRRAQAALVEALS